MAFMHDSITRERAEELMKMKNGADGRFLIRLRPEKTNEYVLGVLFRGRPTHHLITPDANGVLLVNRKQYGNNTTPEALAQFLSKPGVPSWPVPLTQGISPDEELIDMSAPAAATPTATASAPVASQPQEQTQQDAERQAQEEAARKAAQEEAARKAAQEEAARKAAQEEAARQAAQEQAAAQKAAQEEAERRAREDAEQRAREEEAQRTQERAAEEERKAREEAQRQEEAARQAEADARQAREEAERQARDDAARQQRQAQQAQQPQAYVPTAYPLDDDESGGASGQTINGMSFDNSRGGLAASLLGNDPYSPPLSPAVGSRAYNSATTSTVTNPAAQQAEQEAADARLRAERAAQDTAARRAELQALGQHRGLSATASGHNFSMSSDGYSEPVDVQLHKSLAKATIKLGARVTTLEAKVDQIMVSMDEMKRMLQRMQGFSGGAATRM